MEKIRNIIEQVQYVTYHYNDEKEKELHMKEMRLDGYELLSNFEHHYEVIYRKFL